MPGTPYPDRPAATARAIFIAWVLLAAILLVSSWSRIMTGQLPDPDDALRLVQVRDRVQTPARHQPLRMARPSPVLLSQP